MDKDPQKYSQLNQHRLTHINRVLLGIRNVNQLIISEDDPQRLIERACANMTETMGYQNAWIALLDAEGQTVVGTAAAVETGGFTALQRHLAAGAYPDCMKQALAHDGVVVTLNPRSACGDCPMAVEYDGCARLTRRLQHGDRLYGILTVSTPTAYANDAEEQTLFNEMAGDLAFALHKIEAAQRLHASQTMLARTERIAHIGSWEWDIATDQVRWSAELFRIFQRDPAEGAPAFAEQSSLYIAADLHRLQQAVERCVTAGTPYELELRVIRADGEMRYCVARGQAEADDKGQIHRLVGSLQDITERKRTEMNLKKSNQRLESFLQISQSMTSTLEKKTLMQMIVDNAVRGTGLDSGAIYLVNDKKTIKLEATTPALPADFPDEFRIAYLDDHPHINKTIETYKYVIMPDASKAKLTPSEQEIINLRKLQSILYLPINLKENTIGVLILSSVNKTCSFSDEEISLLQGFANQASHIIDNTRNYNELKRYATELEQHITERKHAEEALRQERDLSRALAEAAALINRTLDPDEVLDRLLEHVSQLVPHDTTNIMLIEDNHQVRVVYGRNYARYGTESFIGALNYEFDKVPTLRRMAETGELLVIADTATDPDWMQTPEQTWIRAYLGAPICARGTTLGFLNLNSATPHAFTPLHADILRAFADHAAIALENARIAHDLRQSEQRYRSLFERSNDAIFLVDRRTGRYQAANAAAEKLTGRTVTELQQLTTRDVTPEGAEERLTRAATAQQAFKMGEVQYLRPDGVIREALLDVVPLDDHMAFSIARDITEQKEIEKRLRRQEQLAAIGQLAAGIAHDFRNLLTTIILYAQLGQRKPDVPATVTQYLAIINGEAHKATDLIQQILDFGRRTEIDRQPLDLVAFAEHVIAILQRTLPENIHVALDAGPETCVIEGDAGRLQQALTNLAINARDAMPTGGDLRIGLRRIAVAPGVAPPLPEMAESLAPPAWICLSVTDTGKGMTEEAYAHLFEPFFTTKEEGQGTGLGLAQVYGIIQLHHGYIDVENVTGHGVTFRIYLPAAAEVTEARAETTAPLPVGQGETLLLVEDNAHLREAEQQILLDLGYRVLTAANGREALALYQSESASGALPHLLITDLVMPEMGGKALAQALRRLNPHLKALVMTGYTAEESEAELLAAGFLEVIRKPLDADHLARAIRRALETMDSERRHNEKSAWI